MSLNTAVRPFAVAVVLLIAPIASHAYFSIGVTVGFAPPALPVYEQPPCPGEGYLWTPGYWAYDEFEGYYWVPGTWVLPPEPGLLWTPGYWAWGPDGYAWNAGYWGPEVGFYGGIDYGFGYFGHGFSGGFWRGHDFVYNRAVVNVTNINETNVYYRQIANPATGSSVSYHGGPGGIETRPTTSELAAMHEPRHGLTDAQLRQASLAFSTPALAARVNHGHPPVAATSAVGRFAGPGITVAHGGSMRPTPEMGHRDAAGNQASFRNHPSERQEGPTRLGAARSFGFSPRTDRPPWASPPASKSSNTGPGESQWRFRSPAWNGTAPYARVAPTTTHAITPIYANGRHFEGTALPKAVRSTERFPSWSEPRRAPAGSGAAEHWTRGYANLPHSRSMPSYGSSQKTPARSSVPRVAAGPSGAQRGEHDPRRRG
jgi:hypothetical protein